MAREEKYFHPVKDLLSVEIKDKLIKGFFDYKNILSKNTDQSMLEDPKIIHRYWIQMGFEKQGMPYKEFENYWKNSESVKSNANPGENFARFYDLNENIVWLDDDTHQSIKQISKFYGCDHIVFLYTKGNGVVLKKHTDPNNSSKITFPLYPSYDKYRNCNFYDSMEQEKPTHVCNYSKIRSPVILNVDRIHAVEEATDESLCMQFSYETKYNESLKFLSRKGLLTATR